MLIYFKLHAKEIQVAGHANNPVRLGISAPSIPVTGFNGLQPDPAWFKFQE